MTIKRDLLLNRMESRHLGGALAQHTAYGISACLL